MSFRWAVGGVPEERGRTSRIEIEINPIGDGTELTFTHAASKRNAAATAGHTSKKRRTHEKQDRILLGAPGAHCQSVVARLQPFKLGQGGVRPTNDQGLLCRVREEGLEPDGAHSR